MSPAKLSLGLPAGKHFWTNWSGSQAFVATSLLCNWVCAPTPAAALQPPLGCGFAQEISAAASYWTEELAGPGLDGATGGTPADLRGLSPVPSANGPEQQQGPGSLSLGKEGWAGDRQEAPVPTA